MDKEQIKRNFIEKLKADNCLFRVEYGNKEIKKIEIGSPSTITINFEEDGLRRVYVGHIGNVGNILFNELCTMFERVNELLKALEAEEKKDE